MAPPGRWRRCSRPLRGVGRIVEGKAGGAAAAHGDVARAVALAQEGQHLGDHRAQRDRRLGEIVAALGKRGREARQVASRAASPARRGERAATRREDLARGERDAGIDQQDGAGGSGGAGAGARRRRTPSAARPARHIGTSAPSRAARSNSSSTGRATRHRSTQRPQRRRGVGRAAAETGRHGNALGEPERGTRRHAGAIGQQARGLQHQVLSASPASAGGERPVELERQPVGRPRPRSRRRGR